MLNDFLLFFAATHCQIFYAVPYVLCGIRQKFSSCGSKKYTHSDSRFRSSDLWVMSPTRYRCAKSLRICSALNAHPELFPQAVIQKFTQCPRKIFIIRQAVIQNFSSCVSAFTSYQISVIQNFCHPEFVIQNFCHPEFCRPFHPVLWVSSAATVIRHICHPPGVIQKSGCYSAFLFFTFFRHGTG